MQTVSGLDQTPTDWRDKAWDIAGKMNPGYQFQGGSSDAI